LGFLFFAVYAILRFSVRLSAERVPLTRSIPATFSSTTTLLFSTRHAKDAGPWIDPLKYVSAKPDLPPATIETAKKIGPLSYTVLTDEKHLVSKLYNMVIQKIGGSKVYYPPPELPAKK